MTGTTARARDSGAANLLGMFAIPAAGWTSFKLEFYIGSTDLAPHYNTGGSGMAR